MKRRGAGNRSWTDSMARRADKLIASRIATNRHTVVRFAALLLWTAGSMGLSQEVRIDTTALTLDGSTAAFRGLPLRVSVDESGVAEFRLLGDVIFDDETVRVLGSRPARLIVGGNALLNGTRFDASAALGQPGPGGGDGGSGGSTDGAGGSGGDLWGSGGAGGEGGNPMKGSERGADGLEGTGGRGGADGGAGQAGSNGGVGAGTSSSSRGFGGAGGLVRPGQVLDGGGAGGAQGGGGHDGAVGGDGALGLGGWNGLPGTTAGHGSGGRNDSSGTALSAGCGGGGGGRGGGGTGGGQGGGGGGGGGGSAGVGGPWPPATGGTGGRGGYGGVGGHGGSGGVGGDGGPGGAGGMGGRGGIGGTGGPGGDGGGGAGGAIKISTSVWRLDSADVNAAGGAGANAGSAGGPGRLILSYNSPGPVAVTVEGATTTFAKDGAGNNLGVRAANPHYAAGQSPTIPDLVGGPEAFGFLARSAQDPAIRTYLANAPRWAAAAVVLLDGALPGSDFSFAGHTTLLFVNLHSGSIDHPQLGVGGEWLSPLQEGGPARKTAFGGPGDRIVEALAPGQVYATSVPRDTSRINATFQIMGLQYVVRADNLAQGQAYAFVPDSDGDGLPDTWELGYFGSIAGVGPDDDPDGDGHANLAELRTGTAPHDPGSVLRLVVLPAPGEAGWSLAFPAVAGRGYQPQYCERFGAGDWLDLGSELRVTADGLVALPDHRAGGPPMRFYRIKGLE